MCSKIRYDKLNVLWGKQTPPNNHLLCLADEMIEARTVCPPPQVASERQSSLTACLACHWLTVEKFSWPRIFCTPHSARGHCSHLPTIILFSRQASKDTLLGGSKTNGFPHSAWSSTRSHSRNVWERALELHMRGHTSWHLFLFFYLPRKQTIFLETYHNARIGMRNGYLRARNTMCGVAAICQLRSFVMHVHRWSIEHRSLGKWIGRSWLKVWTLC